MKNVSSWRWFITFGGGHVTDTNACAEVEMPLLRTMDGRLVRIEEIPWQARTAERRNTTDRNHDERRNRALTAVRRPAERRRA